jgi:hypothetical protein
VDGPTLTADPNEIKRGVVVAGGGAYLGIIPVVKPVCTAPVAENAVPVGPTETCAVTGVEGSGKDAVPNPTFVHVIQSTSMLVRSTGELKTTLKTVEEAVTEVVARVAPPGNAGGAPLASVRTAAQPEMSSPLGTLLNVTLT